MLLSGRDGHYEIGDSESGSYFEMQDTVRVISETREPLVTMVSCLGDSNRRERVPAPPRLN